MFARRCVHETSGNFFCSFWGSTSSSVTNATAGILYYELLVSSEKEPNSMFSFPDPSLFFVVVFCVYGAVKRPPGSWGGGLNMAKWKKNMFFCGPQATGRGTQLNVIQSSLETNTCCSGGCFEAVGALSRRTKAFKWRFIVFLFDCWSYGGH